MEKPILFNIEMVKAILNGRKAMTRRIIKPQPISYDKCHRLFRINDLVEVNDNGLIRDKAPYQVGDILWVQETWKIIKILENMQMQFEYRADGVISKTIDFILDRFIKFKKFADKHGWQSPYFMPREAARLFLRVKNVRVELVQDITEEDARAEGCIDYHDKIGDGKFDDVVEFDLTARDAFAELWNSTIKKQDLDKYGWDANPWVWVIEFERVDGGER